MITRRSRRAVGEQEWDSRLLPYLKCLALLENKDFLCRLTWRNETRLKSLIRKCGSVWEGRGRKQPQGGFHNHRQPHEPPNILSPSCNWDFAVSRGGGGKGAGWGTGMSRGVGVPRAAGWSRGEPGLRDGMGLPQPPPCPGVLLGWGGGCNRSRSSCRGDAAERGRHRRQAGGSGGGRHEWLAVSEMGFYGPESSLAPILRCRCQDFAAAWALAAPEVDSPVVAVVGVSGLTEIRLHLRTLH